MFFGGGGFICVWFLVFFSVVLFDCLFVCFTFVMNEVQIHIFVVSHVQFSCVFTLSRTQLSLSYLCPKIRSTDSVPHVN